MPADVARGLPVEIAIRAVRVVPLVAGIAAGAAGLVSLGPHLIEAPRDVFGPVAEALVLAAAIAGRVKAHAPGAVGLVVLLIPRRLLIHAGLGLLPARKRR